MKTTILHVPLSELPGVIRESARAVLNANGYQITDKQGNVLTGRQLEGLLSELGNNAAQSIMSVDLRPKEP
jgi:hypothetical protein